MKTLLLRLAALTVLQFALTGTSRAQEDYDPAGGDEGPPALILYSGENYTGELREIYDPIYRLPDLAFNDRARSVAVLAGQWEVCEHKDFTGRCVFLLYDVPDLAWYGLSGEVSSVRPVMEYTDAEHGLMFVRDENGYIRYVDDEQYGYDNYSYGYGVSTGIQVYHYGYSPDYVRYGYYDPRLGYDPYGFGWHGGYTPYYSSTYYRRERPPLRGHYGARDAAATLYVDSYDRGPSLGINRGISDLSRYRFNDNVSSIQIRSGKWEVCEHANFQGRCQVIDASVDKLNGLRLNDNISSIRPVDGTGNESWDRHERDGRGGARGEWNRGDGDRGGRRGGGPQGAVPGTVASAQPVAPAAAPAPGTVTPQPVRRTGERRFERRRADGLAGGPGGEIDVRDRGRVVGRTAPVATPRSVVPAPAPAMREPPPPRTVTSRPDMRRPVGTPPTPTPRAAPERRDVPPSMRRMERDRRDMAAPAAAAPRRVMPATPPARVSRPASPAPQSFTPPARSPQAAAPARSFSAPSPAPAPRAAAPRPAPAPRAAPPPRDTRPPATRSKDRPTRTQD